MDTRLPAGQSECVRSCFHKKEEIEKFYALVETLLWKNETAAKCLDAAKTRRAIPEGELNDSQLAIETIALLSLEVPNGGLLQFFWNRPEWVERASMSLRSIGLPALAECFERCTAELVDRFGTFSDYRKRDSLRAYAECAGEFTFDEFDSAFWNIEEDVYTKAIEFVSHRLDDFVVQTPRPA